MNRAIGPKAGRLPLLLAFVIVLSLGATGALAGQLPAAIPTFQSPPPTPPPNDNFANATVIPSLPYSDTVDATAATTETGESFYCYGSPNTVWYAFTPTVNMQVRVLGSVYESVLTIYRADGPGIGGLSEMGCGGWTPSIGFDATAGVTYYFQLGTIDGYSSPGALQITVEQLVPPANDNFADATPITSLPYSDAVDASEATTEAGEPQYCNSSNNTVWYRFAPAQAMWVRVDMWGGPYETNLAVYRADSPGIGGLSHVSCGSWGPSVEFRAEAGATYYFQAGTISWYSPGTLQINVQELPPPANDDFADAKVIGSLPFSEGLQMRYATTEADEPAPSCSGSIYKSVWYAYDPAVSGSFTLWSEAWHDRVVAVYTGSGLGSLTEVACRTYWGGGRLTFHGDSGTVYYIQLGSRWGDGDWLNVSLDVAPQPVASFGFWPGDPTIFDTVHFENYSWDPAEVGIETTDWDFGDGTTSSDGWPTHPYAKDGDYTVSLTVTTTDGRSASTSQTVHVATHDVAIVKLVAPTAARVGQTRPIVVEMKNSRYPERVEIQLFKSVPGGFQWVTTTVQNIPVRAGGRTTSVMMSYTFVKDDARMGKVTFKAVANILDYRDALPADNEAISAPTKVSK